MKKILGIIGSRRKFGNCELMVKEVHRNIKIPSNLYLLRLTDFHIKPCRGCYKCLFDNNNCVIKDDMYKVLKAIADADALVLAAPTYFLGPHSSLKTFIDRGLSFYAYLEKLWGKPSVGLAVAGIENKEGGTLLGVENFLKFVMSNVKQTNIVYAALPGEAVLDEGNKKIANSLAENLFKNPSKKQTPHCSLCGGDAFRFIEENKIRCMLCGADGTANKTSTNVFNFNWNKGGKHLFLTKQDVIAHRNWLMEMKTKFISMYKTLKKVSNDYSQEGKWIKP